MTAAVCLFSFVGQAQNAAAPAPGPAPAASASTPTSYKIGVVDRKKVLKGYKKVETEYKKLQAEVEQRQTGITALSEKIEAAKKQYEADSKTMNAADRAQRETQIQNDYRDYQSKLSSQQAEIDTKEQVLMREVFQEMEEAVQKVGGEEGYDIILDGNSRGAIFFAPNVDLSQKIIDILNSK